MPLPSGEVSAHGDAGEGEKSERAQIIYMIHLSFPKYKTMYTSFSQNIKKNFAQPRLYPRELLCYNEKQRSRVSAAAVQERLRKANRKRHPNARR